MLLLSKHQQSWNKEDVRFGVSSNKKDEMQIIRFAKSIGFDLEYIYYPKGTNLVKLKLLNKQFTDNIIKHKSKFPVKLSWKGKFRVRFQRKFSEN